MSVDVGLCFQEVGQLGTMLRIGRKLPEQAVVINALFAEGERTRALASAIMRRLALRSIGTLLVELPGFGESPDPLPPRISGWADAVGKAAEVIGARASVTIRGGALVDQAVPEEGRFRFAPASGAALARDLARAAAVERQEAQRPGTPEGIAEEARGTGLRLSGYPVPASLFADLEKAEPLGAAGRVLRLAGDARPADARVGGPLLWRQAEPEEPDALADAIAHDFHAWRMR